MSCSDWSSQSLSPSIYCFHTQKLARALASSSLDAPGRPQSTIFPGGKCPRQRRTRRFAGAPTRWCSRSFPRESHDRGRDRLAEVLRGRAKSWQEGRLEGLPVYTLAGRVTGGPPNHEQESRKWCRIEWRCRSRVAVSYRRVGSRWWRGELRGLPWRWSRRRRFWHHRIVSDLIGRWSKPQNARKSLRNDW